MNYFFDCNQNLVREGKSFEVVFTFYINYQNFGRLNFGHINFGQMLEKVLILNRKVEWRKISDILSSEKSTFVQN